MNDTQWLLDLTEEATQSDEIQGALVMARYWIYECPGEVMPEREARTIARQFIALARFAELKP